MRRADGGGGAAREGLAALRDQRATVEDVLYATVLQQFLAMPRPRPRRGGGGLWASFQSAWHNRAEGVRWGRGWGLSGQKLQVTQI